MLVCTALHVSSSETETWNYTLYTVRMLTHECTCTHTMFTNDRLTQLKIEKTNPGIARHTCTTFV